MYLMSMYTAFHYSTLLYCILQMNDGRISAIDIKVSKAGPENGYVELPSELESVPWVKQGTFLTVTVHIHFAYVSL